MRTLVRIIPIASVFCAASAFAQTPNVTFANRIAPASANATVAHDVVVTYAKDIAPIFQQNCQQCHQPGSIAPISLLTYEDAKKYSTRIKNKVSARLMPPWHIDKTVGIQAFKNDRSLSDAQIAKIVDWVNAGSPLGDPKDMPAPIKFPDPNRWQLAEKLNQQPDLIIKSKPYTLAAHTQDKWFRPVVETGVTEPRWVRAIEVKPARDQD
ncbi:MAG: cytochrome c, partial [Gemmatimonadaceae bacterium]